MQAVSYTHLAFRADMDALPVAEETGLPFASCHPGRMHACGHDGHMAIVLELARRLARQRSLPHNVLLVFQPAEETDVYKRQGPLWASDFDLPARRGRNVTQIRSLSPPAPPTAIRLWDCGVNIL